MAPRRTCRPQKLRSQDASKRALRICGEDFIILGLFDSPHYIRLGALSTGMEWALGQIRE
jgi:hypothetical protein